MEQNTNMRQVIVLEQNDRSLYAAQQELAKTEKKIAKKTKLMQELSAEITELETTRAEQEQVVRQLETEEVVHRIRLMTTNGEILPSDIQSVLDAATQGHVPTHKSRRKRKVVEANDEQAST